MSIKTVKYTLPNYWANALINNNYDNLSDKECAQFALFYAAHQNFICVDTDSGDGFQKNHDASLYGVLACNVATFTFHVLP